VALALGLSGREIEALSSFRGVPGRLERVDNPRGLDIFVDYAHTPDALDNVQQALRAAGFRRLLVLFGCGGDRDRTKRPLMGQAVARHADVAILTSDNPRHEDPQAIIADVLPGFPSGNGAPGKGPRLIVEPDRRRALALAVAAMEPGDGLLVAGKGHETYQIVGDVKHPFSDAAVIKDLLG
jgi:UDP-N-acetylmuramoyl-L-alanyl-D-glutamate--2,6-diaminopimelate ligase